MCVCGGGGFIPSPHSIPSATHISEEGCLNGKPRVSLSNRSPPKVSRHFSIVGDLISCSMCVCVWGGCSSKKDRQSGSPPPTLNTLNHSSSKILGSPIRSPPIVFDSRRLRYHAWCGGSSNRNDGVPIDTLSHSHLN